MLITNSSHGRGVSVVVSNVDNGVNVVTLDIDSVKHEDIVNVTRKQQNADKI